MTDETQRETGQRAASAEGAAAKLLEAAHRLHAAAGEDALGAAIAGLFAALFGAPPVAVRIAHDIHVSRCFGDAAVMERAAGLLDRARRDGLPVLDGTPPAGIALPIASGGHAIGAVYVAHPAFKQRLASGEIEVLKVAAAHIGFASIALEGRKAPADPEAAAAASAATNATLHDAKLVFERRILLLRLHQAGGNVAAASRALGMDRGQLSRLMRRHDIDKAAFRPPGAPPDPPKTS